MDLSYKEIGPERCAHIRLAVMDLWKAFRNSANRHAPEAAILFDKFHVIRHLGEAIDKVRKTEYARVTGSKRKFIKSQKYVFLSNRKNLSSDCHPSLHL